MRKLLMAALLVCGAMVLSASERMLLNGKYERTPAVSPGELPAQEAKWTTGSGLQWNKDGVHNIWVKTDFDVPADWTNSRFQLYFDVIHGNAIIYVNGKKVGERLGPIGGIDVSNFIEPGKKNHLLVFATRDYTGVSRTVDTDPIRNSARGPKALWSTLPLEQVRVGINPPYLVRLPNPAALADAWMETSWKKKEAELKIDFDVQKPGSYTVECDIFAKDGKKALDFKKTFQLNKGLKTLGITKAWQNPETWELDKGYLYTAKVVLKDASGKVVDKTEFPFGFREVWVEGKNMMLNGHPIRFRTEWAGFGLTKESISMLKLLGRNMIYFQSNPTAWWRSWGEIPSYPADSLRLCDENGIAVLMPVPTVNYARNLYNKAEFQKDFTYEMTEYLKRFRHNTSILAYCVALNSFNPRDGIHPDSLGKRIHYDHVQAKTIKYAIDLAHEIDHTRLGYAHADGNLGDFASGNTYPNFAPTQEVADWPARWAVQGDMPWWACEYAAVYDGSYYKGSSFLLSEYAAIYFGDKAYDKETIPQLQKTIENGCTNKGHGNIKPILDVAPLYWDVQKLYVDATDRAWRTYGVLGWHYFNFSVGYGNPPEFGKSRKNNQFSRYGSMTKPVTSRPEWANPLFDIHAKDMQKLLIYIGGYPAHTDKTHSFKSGETIEKSIATVWDGPGDLTVDAKWDFCGTDGKVLKSGTEKISLKPGDIRLLPVKIAAPQVAKKTCFILKLSATGWEKKTVTDEFKLEVFPTVSAPKMQSKVTLFDPASKSQWVKQLVPNAVEWKNGAKWNKGDLLILGRESIQPNGKLPYTAKDIENGLRVLVLEQKPETWEAFGFRSIEPGTRIAYFGTNPGMLANGLNDNDLRFWRGTPDLLPEFKLARAYDVRIAPKSTNRNTIASAVLEIPATPSFEPLASAEFDMSYTPLLRWNHGKGGVLFNTFDLSGRIGNDPAATHLAANLLSYMDKLTNTPKPTLVNYGKRAPESASVLERGGTVLNVALSADELKKAGIETETKKLYRVMKADGKLKKLAPRNLLRWRDELTVSAIKNQGAEGEGIYLERPAGKGKEIFLQVSPDMLENRYKDDKKKQEAIEWSVLRLRQLIGRILTANGADSSDALASKLCDLRKSADYIDLNSWQLLGPYYRPDGKAKDVLEAKYSGEEQALKGDTNPNFTYKSGNGGDIDFRKTVEAGPNGFVDLGHAYGTGGKRALSFAVREIVAEEAYTAYLRLGFDWYMLVYLNGELVADYSRGHGSGASPNKFKLKIHLKKGTNVLTLKILSGGKGFGFWANISAPGASLDVAGSEKKELIYDPQIKLRNPYEFAYW